MRIFSTSVFAAALLAIAGCSTTGQQTPSRYTRVNLVALGSAEAFEVLTRAGYGKADYFCAAGEFARDELGARNSDRMVVLYSRAPSQYRSSRLAMGFRLAGSDAQSGNAFFLGPRPGQVMSVGHALGLCNAALSRHSVENDDEDD